LWLRTTLRKQLLGHPIAMPGVWGRFALHRVLPREEFMGRRSLMPPLLGILLSVPLTELAPMLGLPALSAPNVVATWPVLTLGFVEESDFDEQAATP
jgi:urea transporter